MGCTTVPSLPPPSSPGDKTTPLHVAPEVWSSGSGLFSEQGIATLSTETGVVLKLSSDSMSYKADLANGMPEFLSVMGAIQSSGYAVQGASVGGAKETFLFETAPSAPPSVPPPLSTSVSFEDPPPPPPGTPGTPPLPHPKTPSPRHPHGGVSFDSDVAPPSPGREKHKFVSADDSRNSSVSEAGEDDDSATFLPRKSLTEKEEVTIFKQKLVFGFTVKKINHHKHNPKSNSKEVTLRLHGAGRSLTVTWDSKKGE